MCAKVPTALIVTFRDFGSGLPILSITIVNIWRPTLALLTLITLTACTHGGPSASSSARSTPSADAAAVLAASTAALAAGNYHFTAVMPGIEIDGVAHLPGSYAETTVFDDENGRKV